LTQSLQEERKVLADSLQYNIPEYWSDNDDANSHCTSSLHTALENSALGPHIRT